MLLCLRHMSFFIKLYKDVFAAAPHADAYAADACFFRHGFFAAFDVAMPAAFH